MPRNGSGGYNLPAGNPVQAGTIITDSWANGTVADIANELANSMTLDGSAPLTGALKFTTGTVTTPSITFNVEQNTGIYRPAPLQLAVTVNGVDQLVATTTGLGTKHVYPTAGNVSNLGTTTLRYNTVYAVDIRADTSTFTGNITGVASSARYADLAERYHADAAYKAGTVVSLGGEFEITQENEDCSNHVFGVISTAPGFMMNSEAGSETEYPCVALAGRVPVRCVGTVMKGDRLVSAGKGCARAALFDDYATSNMIFAVIGRALEDKETEEEGLLLAVVPRQ